MSTVSTSFAIQYKVKTIVSKSVSVVYGVRTTISPGRVLVLQHAVRQITSKSCPIQYGVRVPISSNKTLDLVYDVRFRVENISPTDTGGSFSTAYSSAFDSSVFNLTPQGLTIEYNTLVTGNTTITKSVEILYHTLIKSTSDEIITVPVERDSVPPQIVTTSF